MPAPGLISTLPPAADVLTPPLTVMAPPAPAPFDAIASAMSEPAPEVMSTVPPVTLYAVGAVIVYAVSETNKALAPADVFSRT